MVEPIKRKITSVWIDPEVHLRFMKACHDAGRKSCDVLEPLEKAFIWMVTRHKREDQKPCPFAPLNITIETMKLESLYEKRGPKSDELKCGKTGEFVRRSYCVYHCRSGGANARHRAAGRIYDECHQYHTL